ncbi:MAG: spore cortex biosynthesis protein YabQ [Clostridia bacterium]|nr:spore cortex biosynthesis protein YabQ [Clostridia bacterium]
MSVSEQGRNFCLFFIIGLLIGFLFDIFRGFRRNLKLANLLVDLQDVLFLLLSGLLYLRSVLLFNHGNLRFYLVLSSAAGIVIYALTLSESCVIMIEVVFRVLIKLLKIPYYFAKKNKKQN